jgi:hypothetical protein
VVAAELAQEAAPLGVALVPGVTEGSAESAALVCEGVAQLAVGQGDTLAKALRSRPCGQRLVKLGVELYDYNLYLFARADAPFDDLAGMARHAPAGQPALVGAGRAGSGGQDTMSAIVEAMPEANLRLTYDGGASAEEKVASGQLLAYAVMDAPGSAAIRSARDRPGDGGEPAFKLISAEPPRAFFRGHVDPRGEPIYRASEVSIPGWFSSDVETVSVPAAMVADQAWVDANRDALAKLTEAAKRARGAIQAGVAERP